jgi:cytochrome c-type biogenesis protein CcmE
MHALRRRKLTMIILILFVLALACACVLYALRQNISLYYTPSQIVAGEVSTLQSIRVGGIVVKGSIHRDTQDLEVQFKLTDYAQVITVNYQGILPDLFREGQGIIAQGHLQDDLSIQATQVLAKHDENYMPPEVKASLKMKKL